MFSFFLFWLDKDWLEPLFNISLSVSKWVDFPFCLNMHQQVKRNLYKVQSIQNRGLQGANLYQTFLDTELHRYTDLNYCGFSEPVTNSRKHILRPKIKKIMLGLC